jgi:hypothetical protein
MPIMITVELPETHSNRDEAVGRVAMAALQGGGRVVEITTERTEIAETTATRPRLERRPTATPAAT